MNYTIKEYNNIKIQTMNPILIPKLEPMIELFRGKLFSNILNNQLFTSLHNKYTVSKINQKYIGSNAIDLFLLLLNCILVIDLVFFTLNSS